MNLSKYLMGAVMTVSLAFGTVGVAYSHEGEDHKEKKMERKVSAQGKRVIELLEKYAAAVQAGDISEIEKYVVTDDGFSSLEGTFEDLGWASYRKHLTSELPMFNDVIYKLTNIRPYVKRKMAYATMDYAMDVTIKSDKFEGGKHRLEMKGKATMVLVKVDKEWKVRHIHTVRAKPKKAASEKNSH
jgi:ketosteroid isomerase-like protein